MTKKILIVDDEFAIRTLLEFTLDNYQTLFAENGEEALQMVKEHNPEMIILDLMMPKIDGFKVLKDLKSNFLTKNIYVMILTAKHQEKDLQEGIELGADEFMTKPFEPSKIKRRIDEVFSMIEEKKGQEGKNSNNMGTLHYIRKVAK